jgi:phospholipid/cholesterol/gamma-HCH transport system permease protein
VLKVHTQGDVLTLELGGAWGIDNIAQIERELTETTATVPAHVRIVSRDIERFDLSGAWLLRARLEELRAKGAQVDFDSVPPHFQFMDEIEERERAAVRPQTSNGGTLNSSVAAIGRVVVRHVIESERALGFFGRYIVTGVRAFRRWHSLRVPSIARHVYETGIQAIPIVALIAFLISVIVAYLGAQQLRQFGADIFTVDLVTIGVLREMGVLLTSVIVAGRSGSAFAAEIGVMKLNEEVDALESMGMNSFEVLVLPRVLGLVIALPLLTVLADAMGLAGGALLSRFLLHIPFEQFVDRAQDALSPTTFWSGLVKAPVFAALIALTGTYRGLQVRDSSRELGRLTTVAVVQAIFLVIFADAIFAIIFVQLDF